MRFTGRKIYMTGATGFIGNAVARKLLSEGADVTCLVRPQTDAADLERLGAHIARGNVTEPQTLDLSGHHTAIHAAAWVGFGIPQRHVDLFRRTNIEGTRNVLDAARRAHVGKFVHVSSVAALGESTAEKPKDEASIDRRDYGSEYERTKTESHLAAEASGMPTVLPMPGLVLGPEGPFEWLIAGLAKGKIPALPSDDAVKGWVHVEDTADAILECALHGQGPYILVDESARMTDLLAEALEEAGLPVPRRRIPTSLLLAGAGLIEAAYTLRRKTPPVSRELVGKLRIPMLYDATRARKELNWRPALVERLANDLRTSARR